VRVSSEIVDQPFVHVIRDVELVHLVQHRRVANSIECFAKVEGNDNDIRVIG